MRKRNKYPERKIRPLIWVFCEGETEFNYVSYLRSKYRTPIEIITKVSGSRISSRHIENSKQGYSQHTKDLNFLMYDADVQSLLPKLESIKNTTLLLSNPSIEIWFLLHFKNQCTPISTSDCVREINKILALPYKKGYFCDQIKHQLDTKEAEALIRAKKLKLKENPSSSIYMLIETLDLILTKHS